MIVPEGLHPDLEGAIELAYDVTEVHVVEVTSVESIPVELGMVAAEYFSDSPIEGKLVGFTSWSTTLQVMARELVANRGRADRAVVEMLGDLGSPDLQHEAAQATQRLATSLGAEPVFLRTPGVVSDPGRRAGHPGRPLRCPHDGAVGRFNVAFVGVGPADTHGPLLADDNFFSTRQLRTVRDRGAVGQLVQRFIDGEGRSLTTELDNLVVGITLAQLRVAGRRTVVAGGQSKHAALTACLRGGWVDLLITDLATARHLDAMARTVRRPIDTPPAPIAERAAPIPFSRMATVPAHWADGRAGRGLPGGGEQPAGVGEQLRQHLGLPITGMKLASPPHRGTRCWCRWGAMPAPAAGRR